MSTHFAQGLIDLNIDLEISLHGILFWAFVAGSILNLPHTSDGERVVLGYSGLAPYAPRDRQTPEIEQGKSSISYIVLDKVTSMVISKCLQL